MNLTQVINTLRNAWKWQTALVIKLTAILFLSVSSQSFGGSLTVTSVEKRIKTKSNVNACPSTFFDLSLPESINTCTQFSSQLPATLSLHSPQSPQDLLQFFSTQTLTFTTQEKQQGRFVLLTSADDYRVIISADNSRKSQGSQVYLLYIDQ